MRRFRYSLSHASQLQQWLAWGLLLAITLLYALWMCDQSILRYTTFKATAFDLGNFDQAIWNTLHGRFFQFTNHGSNWYGTPIRLAQHVEPIIIPLSLLYLFHANPQILLIFQTLAIASGALPAFLLTRKYLPRWPLFAPLMAAAYLFSPAVIGENIYDFHTASLASPLLLYAILALTYRRYRWFVLACILTAACKEEMPFVVALLGLLVIWKYKLPRLGALLFMGGTLWFLLAFLVIEPHFNLGAHTNTFWYRYAALGNSPGSALVNVLLHPWLPFALFVTLDRVYYLASLLRSAGFLALLAPEWLLPTLPSMAINLLSSESYQHSGVYHYNAAIAPFIVIAAIHGIRRILLYWYQSCGDAVAQEELRESSVLTVPLTTSAKTTPSQLPLPGERILQNFFHYVIKRFLASLLTLRNFIVARPRFARVIVLTRRQLLAQGRSVQARLHDLATFVTLPGLQWFLTCSVIAMIALNYFIATPLLNIFWADHHPSTREQRIEQLLAMIPPDAVVSAGGNLNPHLSERQFVTVFPELTVATMEKGVTKKVDYVIVDLTNVSPEDRGRSAHFLDVLNQIQRTHQFHIVAQADGVLLLARNNP